MERPGTEGAVVAGVVAVWLLRGVDLQHSDLAVQRTLVAVRRQPTTLPGDLVADHAVAHPGLWLDVLALLPDHPLVLGGAGLLASGLAAALAYRLVRILGGASILAGLGALVVLMPRLLPGLVPLMPAAPTSRAVAIPLVLASWRCIALGRAEWGGVWAGLACAVHPAVGGGALLVGAGLSPLAGRVLGAAAVVGIPTAWMVLTGASDGAGGSEWWPVVVARWDHHLRAADAWAVLGACGLLVGATGLALRGSTRLTRRAAVVALLVMVGSAAVAVVVWEGGLPPLFARTHPWYWWVGPTLWVLLSLASQLRTEPLWRFGGVLVLSSGLQLPLPAWRDAPPPASAALLDALAELPADRPIWSPMGTTPWIRLQAGRAVITSIKDGAEVIASPTFARRWSARILDLCGLVELPGGPGPGWLRFRRTCVASRERTWWQERVLRYRVAAVCVPEAVVGLPGEEVAPCPGGRWVVPHAVGEGRPGGGVE